MLFPRKSRLLIFWLVAPLILAAGRAISADAVSDAVPQTIRKLDLQVTLPHSPEDEQATSWELPIPLEAFWVLAPFGAAVLIYILRDTLPGWRARDEQGWHMAGGGPSPAGAAAVGLGDADELASQGRFVDAMHLLLLFSLAEIRRRSKLDFADSLTSREIVRRAKLPDDGTSALRGIVTRVELSYFGDYPASQADYDSCRARYEVLADVLARSPN